MTLLLLLLELRSMPEQSCLEIGWWLSGCGHYVLNLSDCEQAVMSACSLL